MISNLEPASELFLANVSRVQERLAEANRQVSSGKRISVASDAPDQVGPLLQLRAGQRQNEQVLSNLTLAKADAGSADGALASAIKLLDRAVVLASQGANTIQSTETRASIAQEIEALLEQMVACSQTTVQGRYIFSGDQDGSPAYEIDPAAPGIVIQLSSSAATRRVQDNAGGTFPVSMTAQQIFDDTNSDGTPAGDNVFAALSGLRQALLDNNEAGMSDSITAVRRASAHLNSVQSFYGSVQDRIQAATDQAESYSVRLTTEISGIEDADVTTAALNVTQANTQLQAAFQMRALMPRTSLFNYLG
jgi:flagellar hook-associated protein 3 FlgL